MITVVVSLPIRPNQRRTFVTGIVPLILDSLKPDGNLSVECFESVGTTGCFLLLEQWSSQEAMDAWLHSDRFLVLTNAYRDLLAGPPTAVQLTGSLTPAPA
jgi:quinol monooxygenase YgiN